MKEKTKGFICGVIASVLVLSLSGAAFAVAQTISVSPINIMVNGQEFKPKDANGGDVPVFVYNGTTYAPLRALAESFGLEVGYDPALNMATVNQPSAGTPTGQPPVQPAVSAPMPTPSTPAPVPSPAPAPGPAPSNVRKVYITKTGKRYHYDPSCNGGTYYESTLDEALRLGLTPCNKCVN